MDSKTARDSLEYIISEIGFTNTFGILQEIKQAEANDLCYRSGAVVKYKNVNFIAEILDKVYYCIDINTNIASKETRECLLKELISDLQTVNTK